MANTEAAKEAEMIVRQISWLRVYCLELNRLEQPGMPMEEHQKGMASRAAARQFFWLASSLIYDALIMGLDNVLDSDKRGKQLTLEHIVKGVADAATRKECEEKLHQIRQTPCCRAIAIARNHRIAHPNRETLLQDETPRDPLLKIACLEGLLREVTNLAARALGKLPSDLWFEEWKGVSELFRKLPH